VASPQRLNMLRKLREWLFGSDEPSARLSRVSVVSKIIVSARLSDPDAGLLAELRQHRESSGWQDEITQGYKAFLLHGGLGPPTYLTEDGRILWHDDIWDVQPTRGLAISAIVAGAKRTGIARLMDLLPRRPEDASTCAECDGSGWFDAHGQLKDVAGKPFAYVCTSCAGLGWKAASFELSMPCADVR
jgi:hypothetical protein